LDWFKGPILQVVDGDTFDVRVEWVGKANRNKYNDVERVRLAGGDAPEFGPPGGQAAKERLSQQIAGRCLRCYVHSRDTYGRLVCDVNVVPCRQSA
jgi:endonuclease YncB( thermonuclease family)